MKKILQMNYWGLKNNKILIFSLLIILITTISVLKAIIIQTLKFKRPNLHKKLQELAIKLKNRLEI